MTIVCRARSQVLLPVSICLRTFVCGAVAPSLCTSLILLTTRHELYSAGNYSKACRWGKAAMQSALPQWLSMYDASFLIVQSFWRSWYEEIIQIGAGTVVLATLVFGIIGDYRCWKHYLRGVSTKGAFHLYCRVAQLLTVLAVGSCVILIPLYVTGANL